MVAASSSLEDFIGIFCLGREEDLWKGGFFFFLQFLGINGREGLTSHKMEF